MNLDILANRNQFELIENRLDLKTDENRLDKVAIYCYRNQLGMESIGTSRESIGSRFFAESCSLQTRN